MIFCNSRTKSGLHYPVVCDYAADSSCHFRAHLTSRPELEWHISSTMKDTLYLFESLVMEGGGICRQLGLFQSWHTVAVGHSSNHDWLLVRPERQTLDTFDLWPPWCILHEPPWPTYPIRVKAMCDWVVDLCHWYSAMNHLSQVNIAHANAVEKSVLNHPHSKVRYVESCPLQAPSVSACIHHWDSHNNSWVDFIYRLETPWSVVLRVFSSPCGWPESPTFLFLHFHWPTGLPINPVL